ncbi:MAG TPA: HAMP domain-containing sensor histidine kinase [Roseomonas sp.]
MPREGAPRPGETTTLPQAPPLGLLRSAGARFALIFAITFVAAAIAFTAVLWWGTAGALDRQTDAAVRADALALSERWRDGGVSALVEGIEDRLAADVENHAIYMLQAPDRRRVAGNLDQWPEAADAPGAWSYTTVQREGEPAEARLHDIVLDDGFRLLIGRDIDEKVRLRQLLGEGVAWSFGAAITFAIIGAWLMRGMLARRLRPAFLTAASIAGGDMAHRVALTGRHDEFDLLAATMNTMLDRIDRLMTGVRGVSDAIAHDLRTPIARARAKLEDALATAPDEASLRLAVEQGIADLDAISRVFQALLRIAEAEAGARRRAFAPFDLAPVLADAADIYGAAAEARGQILDTRIPDRLEVVGDRDLLLQAVANLLDNAVKFAPVDGQVLLAATPRPDGGADVVVEDNGPGLAPQDRARAGERFFRADTARTTPGSGLGLSLVQAVAHLHGGSLALADAQPGQESPGLRVILSLGPA